MCRHQQVAFVRGLLRQHNDLGGGDTLAVVTQILAGTTRHEEAARHDACLPTLDDVGVGFHLGLAVDVFL
jgi:hypothetical protein